MKNRNLETTYDECLNKLIKCKLDLLICQEALREIAAFTENKAIVDSSFYEPVSAEIARRALKSINET